jgi:uncharacterized protein involved in response to NO
VAPGSILVVLVADVVGAPAAVVGPIAAVAAAIHAARLVLWRPWLTLSTPIVWILHFAYAWIVLALALDALAAFGLVAGSLATHALTVGAIGGLTMGMMTRTSRGHTGRQLLAGRAERFCYIAIQLAALTRVLLPLALPSLYRQAIIGSGLLWSLAFAVFTITYWPILSQPRLDGKPG